ncbi:MAG TPA: serine/threonine-protein kinase, partial [Polyangiaceae bacterium]|nr:serine/threonine-protein kinase [Polyangiaceae bacterium]
MSAARIIDANTPALISERYRLEAELGRGGMAAVYRAVDEVTGQVVALKKLESSRPNAAVLFDREYRTLASLEHPRVIRVFDFGIAEDGGRYYTMEFLDGEDLHGLAPVQWRKLCEYVRDVATSLLLLHARRLVHRDVSPRNVRFDAAGRAKLLDFGALAPFGLASDIVGTPACSAPEVFRQEELNQRTDLFSLGVVAYWALTKQKPYPIQHFKDVERAYESPPTPAAELVPDIPKALDKLLSSMLSIDPLARPASAAEVIDRLGAIAELDDQPLTGIAESHLSSSDLIGRDREKAQLEQHLERAQRGEGGVVVVEAAAGMGRSRMASELMIQARLSGVTAL